MKNMSVGWQNMPKMRVDTHFTGRLASMANLFKFWNAGETLVCSQSVGKHLILIV